MGKEFTRSSTVIGNVPASGQVLMFDDFEGTFNWLTSGAGVEVAQKSVAQCFRGNSSMYLCTQPTTPLKTDYVKALRYFPMLGSGLIAVDFYYQYPQSNPPGSFWIEFQHDNLLAKYTAAIKFDKDNDIWQYKIQGETFVNITNGDFVQSAAQWNRFRLVLDFLNFRYLSFEINSLKFDLSTILMHTAVTADAYYSNMHLQIFSPANASQGSIYIDDFLISEQH